MAYLKLHSLLQTVLCLSWEEVCFLLGQLGAPLWPGGAIDCTNCGHPETFSQLVPVVRTLLDQHADPIVLQNLLPNLPITNGSTTFAQDLKAYCQTLEWQGFYQQQVSVSALLKINAIYLLLGSVEVSLLSSVGLSRFNKLSALRYRWLCSLSHLCTLRIFALFFMA